MSQAPTGDPPSGDEPTRLVTAPVRLRRAHAIRLDDPAERAFGDYELLEKIGEGGMGAVYRARQLSLEREVALKLLDFDVATGEELVARFRSEARHAGRLQHPNIVPVYEIGRHGNLYYFSMGLVRGPNLYVWRKAQGRPSPQAVARLMRTVAEAVEYAHQVGILHLDLKPANILLDERGQPHIADFGLARRREEAAAGGSDGAAGTPGFMAPEQSGDEGAAPVSAATDVWGLGAILHALLVGGVPVPRDELGRVRDWAVRPPRDIDAGVPRDLDAICMHCLQPDPARRYPSARALADDLQRYLDGRPVGVRRQGALERLAGWVRREPRTAMLAAALLAAMLGGLAATTGLWVRAEDNRRQAQTTLWDARRASALSAAERGDPLQALPALVANVGEAEAAGSRSDALADRLRIGLALDAAPRQIRAWQFGEEGRALAFAEHGQLLLAGLRDGQLVALDTRSGSERWRVRPAFPDTPWGASFVGRIEAGTDARHAVLYPSGSSGVVRPDTSHMHRVDLLDGRIASPPAEAGEVVASSWSSDGSHALLRAPDGSARLWRADPWQAVGPRLPLGDARYCLVLPAGVGLACAGQGFTRVQRIDARSGRVVSTWTFEGTELASWAASPDGRWLALGAADGGLRVVAVDRDLEIALGDAGEGAVTDLAFDGGYLAVAYGDGSLRLLDLQRGQWASAPVRSSAERLNALRIDIDAGWLLGNDGRVLLWRLRARAEGRIDALASGVLRHSGAVAGFQGVALHAPSGLLASHGSEGELKLFRLPGSAGQAWASRLLPGKPGAPAPRREPVLQGNRLVVTDPGSAGSEPVVAYDLPARPYLLEGSSDGDHWIMAADRSLLLASAQAGVEALALPSSAQYLLVASEAPRALVGWIADSGPLRIDWRGLDLRTRAWSGPGFSTDGLPSGVALAPAGDALVLWQGPEVSVHAVDADRRLGRFRIEDAHLHVADVAVGPGARQLILATADRSRLLPATLEQWTLDGAAPTRRQMLPTPSAHTRVFDLGEGRWLAHGPRPALYAAGQRHELMDLATEAGEAAAVSPDRRWAALGTNEGLVLVDLQRRQLLGMPLALELDADDVPARIDFSADGRQLRVRSQFGRQVHLPVHPDGRPVATITREAGDLAPSRDQALPGRDDAALALERAARDPGPPHAPMAAAHDVAVEAIRVDEGVRGHPIDLTALANVPVQARFQGSRRGLGITDSAGWPHGLLRLRGEDYRLGPALQLAPSGVALGAASFPSEGPLIPLPDGAHAGLRLLLTNQVQPEADGLQLRWHAADGRVLALQPVQVPTAWDTTIHGGERAHQPQGDVALILRTSESRQRGGGSPQLLVYRVALERPVDARDAVAVSLQARAATPLLLAISAD